MKVSFYRPKCAKHGFVTSILKPSKPFWTSVVQFHVAFIFKTISWFQFFGIFLGLWKTQYFCLILKGFNAFLNLRSWIQPNLWQIFWFSIWWLFRLRFVIVAYLPSIPELFTWTVFDAKEVFRIYGKKTAQLRWERHF